MKIQNNWTDTVISLKDSDAPEDEDKESVEDQSQNDDDEDQSQNDDDEDEDRINGFSELVALVGCEDLACEIAESVKDGETDFTHGGWRFIRKDEILDVLTEELKCDEDVLGAFNAWFIADVTGWPLSLIEAAQKADGYSELGESLVSDGFVPKMAEAYADADGYGHHFNSYDGSEDEITLNGENYFAFNCRN